MARDPSRLSPNKVCALLEHKLACLLEMRHRTLTATKTDRPTVASADQLVSVSETTCMDAAFHL